MLDFFAEYGPASDSVGNGVAGYDYPLRLARLSVGLIARMSLVLDKSEMSITQLHDMLHGSGMVYFELITGLLISIHAMVALMNNPGRPDTEKLVKVVQAHLALILFFLAVLCPVTTVPIAFVLSANSLLSVACDYAKGREKVTLKAELANVEDPGSDTAKALQASLTKQLKCNDKLLQRMLLLVLGIVGITLMVCPGTQLVGAVVLLSNLAMGIATTVKPVPLHAIGSGVGRSLGLWATATTGSISNDPVAADISNGPGVADMDHGPCVEPVAP